MKELFYAGIGSRKTPGPIIMLMAKIAEELKGRYTLRSGGAEGADSAFARGAGDTAIVIRPKQATEAAIELASRHHPAWHHCNDYVRRLHGRNSQIILGMELDEPAEFVLCWTPGGKDFGGTGLGIRIAEAHNIPVFNFAIDGTSDRFARFRMEGCND